MSIKIALILSVVLQFAAATIALSLVKRTRTNIAWWLISVGFLLMAIRRVFEVMEWYDLNIEINSGLLSGWTAVLISLLMLLSLIFIKRIFNIQKQIETLRKKNESRVLSAILKTEEKERQHFAKELHDGLGPLLSSVKMAISASLYDNTENKVILGKAEDLIDESITSLKNISTKLSPHVLIDFGLLKAVRSFIGKLQIASKPIIRFNSNIENKRFSYNIEVVLYRVICELISNTLKHADAHNIFIDLLEDGKSINLKYIDDGKGFDVDQEEHKLSGMGYSNMKSRIKSLNGSIEIFSRPGEGVNIDIKISTINNEKG
jgi:signal transduction histidine kinase